MDLLKRRSSKEFGFQGRAGRSARRFSPGLDPLEERLNLSVTLMFDYSRDSSGFFQSHPEAKTALSQAAAEITAFITDSLTKLDASPGSGPNTWTANFFEPTTGASTTIPGPAVPADTLLIYAGARVLHTGSSGELAEAGAGGFGIQYNNQAFYDNVVGRGNPGALSETPTKFTPWGGSIAFDTGTNWDFSIDAIPAAGKQSFFQTAQHEIGHLMGVGSSTYQWQHWITGGAFRGPSAMAANGNQPIPVDASAGHWANNTVVNGIVPAMVPIVRTNPPNLFSPLDYAALRDIGWSLLVLGPGGASFTAQALVNQANEGGDVSVKITPAPGMRGLNVLHVKTADGTAKAGVNYQAVDTYLNFYPWDGPKTVTIRTLSDGKPTVDLGFALQLLYAESGVSGNTGSIDLTVVNTTAGNRAPTLDAIPAQSGTAGTLFTYQAHAVDPDAGQTITYSLGVGAPSGASIDPSSGLLSFTPSQASTAYQIPIVATDNGNPVASDTKTLVLNTKSNQPVAVNLTVTPSATTSSFGQSILFLISASSSSGSPTGSVSLFDGNQLLATRTLDAGSKASVSLFDLPTGSHSISARYNGDAGHLGTNSSTVMIAVATTATRLDINGDAAAPFVGQTVVFTATPVPLAPGQIPPSGAVTFLDNGRVVKTVPLLNGVAAYSTVFGDTKTKHSITASYPGNGGFGASKSAAFLSKAIPAPIGFGLTTSVTGTGSKAVERFVITVAPLSPASGVPGGTVAILINNKAIASGKLVNGRAVLSVAVSKVAGKSLVLSYSGEARFLAKKSDPITV